MSRFPRPSAFLICALLLLAAPAAYPAPKGPKKASARKAAAQADKRSRRQSRRERAAEIARRQREAAERARQRAIALARIRAANEALRYETVANILRDETTGEDAEIRRVAIQALGDRAGTVVVMNPKTGQVYTVVNQEWALRRGFKPCSTIKLVTGLAGLSESVIDPVQTVNIGAGTFGLDLTDSLALSNNGYFQRVGGEVGFQRMMDYARRLGLGQPTGINHASESPGRLPLFKEGYAVNHMSSHGDDIEVTAIQLANMAAAVANGGKLLVPHLPRTPEENTQFRREVRREVNAPREALNRLVPGMIGAVNYGTARRASAPTMTVAGKTGTCTGQGSKLGLFTSYGPAHDPQLAVAVILRNSGTGGKWAAAVAGDIYRNLSHRFGPRSGAAPALADALLAPRTKLDARAAAEASDEENEEEGDAKSADDAYVVSEAATESVEKKAGAQTGLKRTLQTYQPPAAGVHAAPRDDTNTRPRTVQPARKPNN